MGNLPRSDAMIVRVDGFEYTVASRFLPTIGSRITMSRFTVEVTGISFYCKEHFESMSGLEGTGKLLGDERDYLTPIITARKVAD
jgi:hypothetical protein